MLLLSLQGVAQQFWEFQIQGVVLRNGDNAPIPNKQVKIRNVDEPGSEAYNTTVTYLDGSFYYSYNAFDVPPSGFQILVTDCNGQEVASPVITTNNGTITNFNETVTVCHTGTCSAYFSPTPGTDPFFEPNHIDIYYASDLIPSPNVTVDWGDGTTTTGTYMDIQYSGGHSYTTNGMYTVCLTANNGTCNVSQCMQQWVGDAPAPIVNPACSTQLDYMYNMFDMGMIDIQLSAEPDPTLRYSWFIDGYPASGAFMSFTQYPSENNLSIHLDVFDTTAISTDITVLTYKNGCYSTASKNVTINNAVANAVRKSIGVAVQDTIGAALSAYNIPQNYMGTPYYYFGTGEPINVQLYRRDNYMDSTLELSQSATTVGGLARFENLGDGNYIARAVHFQNSPMYGVYMPTYYGFALDTSGYPTHWYEAMQQSIYEDTLVGSNSYSSMYIMLVPVASAGGPGQIGGSTDWQDTLLRSSTVVEDVTVWAKNIADGRIYGYAITDANGSFTIGNLPYGTYYIDADYPGYYATHATITIDAGNEVVNDVQIEIVEDMQTIGISETSVEITAMYPNPTNGNTTLSINIDKAQKTGVSIVNMLGQVVYTQNHNFTIGAQLVELPTQDLPTGLYFVSIGNSNAKKLVKY